MFCFHFILQIIVNNQSTNYNKQWNHYPESSPNCIIIIHVYFYEIELVKSSDGLLDDLEDSDEED